MRELSRLIVECLTEGLGLPPNTYTKLETPDAICNARVNHYPACPDPSKVFGIPSHTDPQMLSILYQDDVGGLQVLRNGKWIGIRPDDSTLVVNLGDTFMVSYIHSTSPRSPSLALISYRSARFESSSMWLIGSYVQLFAGNYERHSAQRSAPSGAKHYEVSVFHYIFLRGW